MSSHSVTIPNLTPGTIYHYRVSSQLPNGQPVYSEDQAITTPIGITSVHAQRLNDNQVIFNWYTDVVTGDNFVDYGLEGRSLSNHFPDPVANPFNSHSITIGGLDRANPRHYRVGSRTPTPGDIGFSVDTRVPILGITNVQSILATSNSILISWTTDIPTTENSIDYGTSAEAYSQHLPIPTQTPLSSHGFMLQSLPPGTYHYRVSSRANGQPYATYSDDLTFQVPSI